MSRKNILILLAVIAGIHIIVIAFIAGSGGSSGNAEAALEVVPEEKKEPEKPENSGAVDRWRKFFTDKAAANPGVAAPVITKVKPWNYSRKLSLPQNLAKQADKATGVIIVDLKDRRVLWEKNARKSVPAASLTKLMTALLVAEELERNPDFKLDTVVEMSPAAAAVESRRFNAGEKLTVKDLLFAMMISSSNDAATQAGITLGGDTASFVKKMNERAAAMGLTGVNFNSPSGLPQGGARENSMASCEAIVHLCEAVMKYSAVMEPAGESYAKLSGGRELYTTNGLLKHPTKARPYWRKVPGLFGFKTGYTKAAGCCLAFGVTRRGRTVIGCVTGFPSSADRERFCSDLIEWAYKN